MDWFILLNRLEAVLWMVMGAVVLVYAIRKDRWHVLTAVTLLMFGLSDIVETHTGGWYKPWWLLLWKGTCVIILLTAVWRLRAKRQLQHTPAAGGR